MSFKKGDKVIYIKKCHDHSGNTRFLKLGEIYTVKSVSSDSVLLEEPYWWVYTSCVEIFEGEIHQYSKVCFKVKQLENKFNTRKTRVDQYAF